MPEWSVVFTTNSPPRNRLTLNFRETANPVTLAKATTKWDDSATVQPMLWL